MKRTLTLLKACICVGIISIFNSQFSIFPTLQAQRPWNYTALEDMHLDDAYMLPLPDSLLPTLNRQAKAEVRSGCRYRLSVEYPKPKRPTVRFQSDSCTFALRWQQVEPLLPYLVSDRYWRERLSQLQWWTYVDMSAAGSLMVDTADRRYGRYSPIAWLGYDYRPSGESPVVFTVRTNRRGTRQVELQQVERWAEGGAFTTDAGMTAYEQNLREMQRAEALRQRALQRELDSLEAVTRRQERLTDSIATAIRHDSLQLAEQTLRAEVQATKERMNRDQIFLMNVKTAHSDYMFGLEFNFYNCFPKVISKIEISVTPVNERGQVQQDEFRRSVRTVRCMGPVQPGSPAQYTFDELFWDQKGRIKYMRVSSVTFHFPDGTRRVFNGYEKILKHTLNR